jgi:N-acetylmuramoyl-L-alanine amidase
MDTIINAPSPNFDERTLPISMLILHYTGMQSGEAALERLCDPAAKVSAHYLVEEDGRIFSLVAEEKRAWHGGLGFWRGITDINSGSIGIEIVNPGHEWGYREFPEAQMQAVLALCKDILTRHTIPARNVIGHSDIAPIRKEDPGELFDWKWLAENEVGLWPSIKGTEEAEMKRLEEYGYSLENTEKTILAFQRHFRPKKLTGEWDTECGQILADLLERC